MPTLQTTQNVAGLTALTAGVNFTGLAVLAPGPGMDRVGCCEFAEECLILQITDGQLTAASLYRDGYPTSTGLIDVALPYTLPATTDDQYYRLGYLSGSVTDRLANLPVQQCRDCFSYELTVPDAATLEINDFQANSQLAGTTAANANALQTQINQLLANIDDLGASNNNLQVQLQASQDTLVTTQNDLTTAQDTLTTAQTNLATANTAIADLNTQIISLQAQIDALNAASQDTDALNTQITDLQTQVDTLQAQVTAEETAAAAAAQTVRDTIANLTLRDPSVCLDSQRVISASAFADSATTAASASANETTQALSGGSSGKVVQLRPDVTTLSPNCNSDSNSAIAQLGSNTNGGSPGSGSGSTPLSVISGGGNGRVINLKAKAGRVIPGCPPPSQPSAGCCKPPLSSSSGSSSASSPDETTRNAIAQALARAEQFVPSMKPDEVCDEIIRQKQKLLVQPGCSDPQEISPQSSCDVGGD